MNTSKELFHQTKHETITYSFGLELTKQFFYDEEFQQSVLMKVHSPTQLLLSITYSVKAFYDFPTLFSMKFSVKTLDQILSLVAPGSKGKIHKLKDVWEEFIEAKFCCTVLSRLDQFSSAVSRAELSFCPVMADISCVKNCREVKLVNCENIQDISSLGKVKILSIIHCANLRDVSSLGNVHQLTLINCAAIEDVSNLKNNVILSFGGSPKVENYSSLTNVRDLTLYHPNLPENLNEFKQVKKLSFAFFERRDLTIPKTVKEMKLIFCRLLPDLEFLSQLNCVDIYNCYDVTHVGALGTVPIVKISSCCRLETLEGLGRGNYSVSIDECSEVNDFSPLQSVHTVMIANCPGCLDGDQLKNVRHLTIENSKIEDVSMFGQSLSLKFSLCHVISSLTGLSDVPLVHIDSCRRIKDVSPLTNNQKLIFQGCYSQIKNFSVLNERYHFEIVTESIVYIRRQ
jgi:hypothetical protein